MTDVAVILPGARYTAQAPLLHQALDAAPTASRRLIVAKSFGSFALPTAVELGIPGVWLTPVLTDDAVVAALRAAGPEHLAVGGTSDALWRPERVAGTGGGLLSIADADHALTVPGSWSSSIAAQSLAFQAIAEHLDGGRAHRSR